MDIVTINKFALELGVEAKTIYSKSDRHLWKNKKICITAPDGRLYIDKEAFKNWANGVSVK